MNHEENDQEKRLRASDEVEGRHDAVPEDDEETQTISLLDLMDENEDEGQSKRRDVDDRTTPPTAPPIPTKRPPQGKALPPLAHDRTISSRPPEHDSDATHVQPKVAFPGSTDPGMRKQRVPEQEKPTEQYQRPPAQRAPQRSPRRPRVPERQRARRVPAPGPTPRPAPKPRRDWGGCITRAFLIGLLTLLVGTAMGAAAAAIGYGTVASQLPPVSELRSRASDFETAIIYDNGGNRLYSFTDPQEGNRTVVPLSRISPYVISATIATEDARFYSNPGFDPIGIARAVVQAAQEREIVSGASTITQQLARALLLDEEERTQVTFNRKVKEIILAAEMSRTYEKNEILELYLNEIYYGNLAYGIEAAAQQYYGKPAADLTLSEASLLAGLPQAPALWDPYTAPELALGRQSQVLGLMVQAGYLSAEEAQETIEESAPVVRSMTPPRRTIRYPHFVFTVLQQLEDQLGAQAIYAGGLRVFTTLDPSAQQLAEETLSAHRDTIATAGANNAALVAIEPETGAVRALVGSVDFNDEAIRGQVNMALAPRQPGSAIKPFVYLAAMEEGWNPSTLIWDVPTQFPDGANPPYEPKNYDDQFHGPLRLRPSLGNSYNIPAVKALEYVGVCNFISYLQKFGIALQDGGCAVGNSPSQHGLALALGGGEISPLQLTAAYATLASQGTYHEPYTIERIENSRGELLSDYRPPDPQGQNVLRAAHAFLMSNILSDNEARQPEFAPSNNLVIAGHTVAAKTGTSGTNRFDVRDGWTLGYNPHVAIGVWVGNTDPQPVAEGMSGYRMASPIWRDFMTAYLANRAVVGFSQPNDVVQMEICAASGTRPSSDCPRRINEYFANDQLPPESDVDFLRRVPVDLWTGLRANEYCNDYVYEAGFVNLLVTGRDDVLARETANARRWVEGTAAGQAWAQALGINVPLELPPGDSCTPDTPRPRLAIDQPRSGLEILAGGELEVRGQAVAPNFAGYIVDFGLSHEPEGWAPVQGIEARQVEGGLLATWDTGAVSFDGPVTLRLTVFGPDNPYTEGQNPVTAETRVQLSLRQPTPTPTPTPTATGTPTPTPTPTLTPTPSSTPDEEPEPTEEPEETPEPTPTQVTVTPVIITLPAPTEEP